MLRLDEFRVGNLAEEAGDSLTLLLPRDQYEHAALIGEVFDQRYGIVLDGDLPGQAYLVGNDDDWRGILVPSVSLEVDEKSAFDPVGGIEAGALIREATYLSIGASAGQHPRVGRPLKIVVTKDLPACGEHEAVGFRRWRIAIGEGYDRRELFSVSAEEVAKVRATTLAASRP